MNNNVEFKISKDLCTGCCACQNLCPKDAITMEPNSEGFLYPKVDSSKCVDCGICVAKCPIVKNSYPNTATPDCRAVYAIDDIRMSAASGGIFTAFARVILEQGGYICGAAYNEDFTVSHLVSNNEDGLNRIKSSKYIQSNAGLVYNQIKALLAEGKEVLFGGCPCQVAALYNVVGDANRERLYTMDLVCHGVPSYKVLMKYLAEEYEKDKVKTIDFRAKDFYGWSTEMTVTYEDGTVIRKHHSTDTFYRSFLPCLALRKSCSQCKFSCIPRQGDLSIGDFWGIAAYDKKLNDKKGTSVVLVNNAKGEEIMNRCKDLWSVNVPVPIERALVVNKTIKNSFNAHPGRRRFFENLDRLPLNKNVTNCLTHHYDAGILGVWYGLNYGSILTYYALYSVVKEFGLDAIMINKPENLWEERFKDRNTIANKFIYKHCNVSNIKLNEADWRELNNHCDAFVLGSDVVWNYDICGRQAGQFFFMDFVKDSKKKIAMASSFGSGYAAPEEVRAMSEYYLKKFDYVGVRESDAVEICRSQFGVRADIILDPVFVVNKNVYLDAVAESKLNIQEKFIASYILGPDLQKRNFLVKASEILGASLKNIPNPNAPAKFTERTGLPSEQNLSVEDWLYLMKNTDFFIGDSFHGMCFALIFEKPFAIVLNTNVAGLSRFTSLLGMLGIENRILFSNQDSPEKLAEIMATPIDFQKVRGILEEKRMFSRMWLENALKGPKKYQQTPEDRMFDIMTDRIAELTKRVAELEKK